MSYSLPLDVMDIDTGPYTRFQWVKLELVFFTAAKTQTTVLKKLNTLRESAYLQKLDDVYEKILRFNMGFQEDEDGADTNEEPANEYELELVMRTLQLVFVAQRPLKLKELVEAISINKDGEVDEDLTPALLSKLYANLLTSDVVRDVSLDDNGKVEFTHLSVRDWLANRKGSNSEAPDCSFLDLAHVNAMKTSLLYLQHSESLNLYLPTVFDDTFRDYADHYWPTHYSSLSSDKRKHHLFELVKTFIFTDSGLTGRFKRWSEILGEVVELSKKLSWGGIPDGAGQSVLTLACCFDLPELLEAQRDVIGFDSNQELIYNGEKQGDNALHLAAEYGSDHIIDFLLAANTRCTFGRLSWSTDPTAVMIAIEKDHGDIALKLIPHTPLPLLSATDHWSRTTLMLAEEKGMTRVVAALLEVLPKEIVARDKWLYDNFRERSRAQRERDRSERSRRRRRLKYGNEWEGSPMDCVRMRSSSV